MKKLKILSIEMPKLKPKEIDKLNPIESWICLLETYHVRSKNDIMKLTNKPVKGLLEVSRMAEKISDDWVEEINRILDERAEYESSLEYKLAVARDVGKKEGREEGIELGILQNKKETLQKLLDAGYTVEQLQAIGLDLKV